MTLFASEVNGLSLKWSISKRKTLLLCEQNSVFFENKPLLKRQAKLGELFFLKKVLIPESYFEGDVKI